MAIHRLYAEADATIRDDFPLKNEGFDEILIIGTFSPDDTEFKTSRALVRFSTFELVNLYNKHQIAPLRNWPQTEHTKLMFRLRTTEHTEIGNPVIVSVFPLAESFVEGVGSFNDSPHTPNGVSWQYRNDSTKWISGSSLNVNGMYASELQSNTSYDANNPTGGRYGVRITYPAYTGSVSAPTYITASCQFTWGIADLAVDVNEFAQGLWMTYLTGSSRWAANPVFGNHGIIARISGSDERTIHTGNLNFFSRQTHTIYPPVLDFMWDDYSYASNSAYIPSTPEDILISDRLNSEYRVGDVVKVHVDARPRFPARRFTTSSRYASSTTSLPTASIWKLYDLSTREAVFDFDSRFTRISGKADNSGEYTLYMNSLQPNRMYGIEYNIIWPNGETTTHQGGRFGLKN